MKGVKGAKRPIHAVATWLRRQPSPVKAFLALISSVSALVFLWLVVEDHDNLFVAAEAVHALGLAVLTYKLAREKTCAGLSLKSQILTALFLAVRLYCSFVMEYDIHTLLDLATFITTLWVMYMIGFQLKSSYMEDKDNLPVYYVVIPCAILSILIHPTTPHHVFNRISWALCVYLEAVSILPQLRIMQNAKVWDTQGRLLIAMGSGLWPSMVLLSEIVQTFILADFCYYYVKSLLGGQTVLRLPSGVV